MSDYTAMQERFEKKQVDNQDQDAKLKAEVHRKLVGRAQKVKNMLPLLGLWLAVAHTMLMSGDRGYPGQI